MDKINEAKENMFKNEQTKFVTALLPISGYDIVGSNPGMEFSQFINSPKRVIYHSSSHYHCSSRLLLSFRTQQPPNQAWANAKDTNLFL